MEQHLPINHKMWIIGGLITLLFALLLFFFNMTLDQSKLIGITRASEVMYTDQQDKIQIATHSMALSIGEMLKAVSEPEERLELIRNAVDPIRFEEDKSGYFFVYEKTTVVALPPKKELEGQDLSASKDKQGIFFVKELHQQAKSGGGFVDYIFPKPEAGDQPKIGYAEMIPGTDYWIGTGVYLDNITATKAQIEAQISAAVQNRNWIMYAIVLPLFGCILAALFYISKSIVVPLAKVSTNLSAAADQVTSASSLVSQSGQSLAEGSTQQAASIEETSASLSELAIQTHQNSENAHHADELMQESNQVVAEANREMKNLTTSMSQISQSSVEIHKIISTINEIAFQTNLLALNAAVEAARAGEAGSGFAVVASEVRNLAVRAASSAQNTTQLIDNTSARIQEGEASAEKTKEAFEHIQHSSEKVARIVSEISIASKEQTLGIDQISTAVNEMNVVVQRNTATAEEAAGSSEEMAAQAREMEGMALELGTVVNGNRSTKVSAKNKSTKINAMNPFKTRSLALQSLLLLLFVSSGMVHAQTVNWKGFVSTETYFDSKEAVAAREADVLLYPKKPVYDSMNNDLTDERSFHMVAFNSRLSASVTELEAFGAETKAVIEFDFLGTGESYVNMVRMRHAFIKLKWEKSGLLVGQYWHPLFITASYPEVLGWGGSAPLNVLSRNPQIRFTYQFSPQISGNISALSHRDFTSSGPDGYSSKYIRNSGIPEVNVQMMIKTDAVLAGFTAGLKSIKPNELTPAGNQLSETLQSWHSNAFAKFTSSKVDVKLVGLYGQNLTNLLMLGGYAEKSVAPNNITYTNLVTSSVWTEITSKGETTRVAVFAGISTNHGAVDEVAHTGDVVTANFYGRGTDIASLFRIAPRISFKSGPLLWGLEYTWTSAAYGTPDTKGKVRDTNSASMYRIQLAAKYSF